MIILIYPERFCDIRAPVVLLLLRRRLAFHELLFELGIAFWAEVADDRFAGIRRFVGNGVLEVFDCVY